jgi:signal transduction histidine kinase
MEGYFITVAPGRLPLPEGLPYPWGEEESERGIRPDLPVTAIRRVEGPWGGHFEMQALLAAEQKLHLEDIQVSENAQRSERIVTVPIGGAGDPLGAVELSAGTDFSAEALASISPAFLLAGGGALLLAVALGLLMGGRLSRPVVNLNQAARRMAGGDLSVRAPTQGGDEIGELAAQFNQMAAQLEASFTQLAAERDTLRRFIADASHELRTPITALKNFNELLLGAAADDTQARAEFLTESGAQIERLAWITQNLLDLSRLEAGLASLDLAPQDGGELVKDVANGFKERAARRSISLAVELPGEPFELHCDRQRMVMALSNLLDNALKFTLHGGEVTIGVEPADSGVRFWVGDDGPGIHPDDLPHVFERFYRGRNVNQPGSGLGLAIVHSVVEAHEGTVTVESEPGAGTKVSLQMPVREVVPTKPRQLAETHQ